MHMRVSVGVTSRGISSMLCRLGHVLGHVSVFITQLPKWAPSQAARSPAASFTFTAVDRQGLQYL